jgi:hypothetical protein
MGTGMDPGSSSAGGVPGGSGSVVILIPVFNDWASLSMLLPGLDGILADRGSTADVLVVDDGSTSEPAVDLARGPFRSFGRVEVLALRRNLGHQRAIAIGLAYVEDRGAADAVVVMDGDGEDDPADVPRLLDRLRAEGGRRIVFAERTRRSESWRFRVFYALYKLLHVVLTGQKVRIGNFSAIPRGRLTSLVTVAEMWNHYAAAALQSRQPFCMIPTRRARRLHGRSSMDFVSLVTHGLSAISVYSEVVGIRLLVMSMLLAILALGGLVAVVVVRLATDLAVPGWATYSAGLSLILLVQAIMLAFVFSAMILGARHGSTFLPRRDYAYYIKGVRELTGPAPGPEPLPRGVPRRVV